MDVSEDRCETDADGYSHAALIYGYAHSHSLPGCRPTATGQRRHQALLKVEAEEELHGQLQLNVEVLVGMHYAVYGHTLDQTQSP